MTARHYYPLWFRLQGRDGYLLWSTVDDDLPGTMAPTDSDEDQILVDARNQLVEFSTIDCLRAFVSDAKIALDYESLHLHDLDLVSGFLEKKTASVDSKQFLNAWNLYTDLARSVRPEYVEFLEASERHDLLYDKLFLLNNPRLIQQHDHLVNEWPEEQLDALHGVLSLGHKFFCASRLRRHSSDSDGPIVH